MAPVSFLNSEGRRIKAVLDLPGGHGKVPAAVICPGFGGCSCDENLVAISRALVARGIAALRFDYSHTGESEGPPLQWTTGRAIDDLAAALDYLRRQERIDDARLGAVGFSMGGLVAIHRAAQDVRIRTVASVSAPAFFGEGLFSRDELDQWRRKGRILLEFSHGPAELGWEFAREARDYNTPRAAKALKVPLLVVQGTDDELVAAPTARLICEAASGPCRLVMVEGAGHTYLRQHEREEMVAAVADWMTEHLR
jgi:dipeptidyl aminopeptidase/acylaminoacyl peptidase